MEERAVFEAGRATIEQPAASAAAIFRLRTREESTGRGARLMSLRAAMPGPRRGTQAYGGGRRVLKGCARGTLKVPRGVLNGHYTPKGRGWNV